jgi:2,3-bisphosphoglycerate-dependent phosphoglycerate mutase
MTSLPARVVLAKHALPILDASRPPREWRLAPDGDRQSKRLAAALQRFAPLRLVASPEPKARRTAEIAAAALGVSCTTIAGLEEIDRPALPIMPASEHERVNARLFTDFDRPVIGCESARDARDRFTAAVVHELQRTTEDSLVVVAHGTVIALLVSAHNPVDAFDLWQRLECPSFVVLDVPRLRLLEVVARVP